MRTKQLGFHFVRLEVINFYFFLLRDPNSLATLKTFEKAIKWAKSGEFTQQDIDEAKLAVFAAVDAPIAPSDKGILSAASQCCQYFFFFYLSLQGRK